MTEQERDDMVQEDFLDETAETGADAGPDDAAEAESVAGEAAPVSEGGVETEAATSEVEELREELDSLNDRHLRLAAEFDNYRKRHLRDREVQADRLKADLVGSLLDVLDDLQRVAEGSGETDAEAVLEGVRLVEKKFTAVLEGAGVTPVEAEGARFDPELMEALGMVPTDDPENDGDVADVFQKGYRLGEMLVRPARVRVYQYDESD